MNKTKIKICGLYRSDDIDYVNQYKPDYAGFIIGFPKSHRNINPAQLIQLTRKLNPDILSVGVFVNPTSGSVRRLLEENRIQIAQLHGDEDENMIREIQKSGREVWKAFVIRSDDDLKRAEQSPADRILLDAGQGDGKTFNWELLKDFHREYILAGGLNELNLRDAVEILHPYAVDLSSGVETEKQKDEKKIQNVIEIVRNI